MRRKRRNVVEFVLGLDVALTRQGLQVRPVRRLQIALADGGVEGELRLGESEKALR